MQEHDKKPLFGGKAGRSGARAKRPSYRAAINAFCRWCIVDEKSGLGAWRQQVTACPSKDCPLYAVRPVSSADPRPTDLAP